MKQLNLLFSLFSFCLASFVAQGQTSYSPSSTGLSLCDYTDINNCSAVGTTSRNSIKFKLINISGGNMNFEIRRCDDNPFTCSGEAFIKDDACNGSILNINQVGKAYSSGTSVINISIPLSNVSNFINGSKSFYAITRANQSSSCLGARSHTKPITISASTPIGISSVNFTSSNIVNYNCNLGFSWYSQNMQSNVKIEITVGVNNYYYSTIASSTPNFNNTTNYYNIPNITVFPDNEYKIRVSGIGINGAQIEAYSSFFIATQGTINISQPQGGLTFTLGGSSSMNIAWTSSNLSCTQYTAELWDANTNTSVTNLFNSLSSSPQSWTVSGVPAGTYKVKLYRVPFNSNSSLNVIAWSNNFAIQAAQPALELNAPLSFGAGTLYANQSYTFTSSIKNQGGANWSGSLYLYVNNQIINLGSYYINAGQTVNVNKSVLLTPAMVGTNVSFNLTGALNGLGNGVTIPGGLFHSNPTTVTINAAQAFDLKLNSDIVVTPSSPVVAQTGATMTTSVKNVGNTNFVGTLVLQLLSNNGVYLADLATNNVTLAPNAISTLTYAPSTITQTAANYKLNVVFLPTGGNWTNINSNGFTMPKTFEIVAAALGPCGITSPAVGTEGNTAATYLCQQGIVTPVNGNVNPTNLIIRQDLAKIMFFALFGGANLPTNLEEVTNYPTPFGDLQVGTQPYYKYLKVLSYLEYADGKSPFSRKFYYTRPGNTILRKDVCKVVCETWKLAPLTLPQSQYFDDLASNGLGADEINYINTCAYYGVVNTTIRTFFPNNNATREQAFIMLHRLLTNTNKPPKPVPVLTDFFKPGNYTPDNLGSHPSLSDSNFDQYSQVSFSIADRQLPLVMEHNYNSYLTEIPEELINRKPLGEGWSHSYNSFVFRLNGYIYTNPDNGSTTTYPKVWVVFWPNGTMHLYNAANNTSINKGNYDELSVTNVGTDTTFVIKKKNQVTFTFKRGAAAAATEPFLLDLIKDRNNNTIDLNYTLYNGNKFRLFEVVAPSGRKLNFAYNGTADDKISSVTDPLGRIVRFYYGGSQGNDLLRYIDADGKETTYNYGLTAVDEHLLKIITLPNGNFMDNFYDRRKMTSSQTKNATTGAILNATSVTNFAHNSSGTNYIGTSSTVNSTSNGATQSYNYVMDNLGNVKSVVTPTSTILVTYNSTSNHNKPETMTLNGVQAVYTYDPKGNVWTSTLPDPNGGSIVHEFTYNSFNDPMTYKNPRGFTTTFDYYPAGNLKKITNPIGFTQFGVNAYGQVETVTNPENIVVTYGYNAYGNINSVTAPLNITSTMDYDLASRMYKSVNPLGKQTLFGYDNRDNMTNTTDAMGHLTQFQFDDNSNLKKIINAKGGETNLGYNYFDWLASEQFGANIKQYDYYDDGKLKKYTKPDNTAINYTYNTATQLLETDGYTNFTYDSPRNRLKTVTYQSKVITFSYDNLDRITSTVYDGNTVGYSYDKNNNVTTITYPGSKVVTYTYDELDRLKTVSDWNNQVTTYFYKKDSRLDYTTLPNGVITTNAYDAAGRMAGYNTKKGTTVICQYTFDLDFVGNHKLENKQEPVSTYASMSNASLTAQYDNQNRIITHGTKNFTFDANGCTKTKTGRTYNWDVYDRLTSVSGDFTALYEYDGLGNRRRAVRNGAATKFVLNILGMSQVLMETNDANVAQNYYVYGLGLISRIKPDNTTRYYHSDFRGSVVAMSDGAGTVTHKYQYDEFGTVLQKTEQDENRFRYVGMAGVQYEDSTLIFMRARYYDPEIGRFLSEDPIWSANLYPYAGNNPVTGIDPTGLKTVDRRQFNGKGNWNQINKKSKMYGDLEDTETIIKVVNGNYNIDDLTDEGIDLAIDKVIIPILLRTPFAVVGVALENDIFRAGAKKVGNCIGNGCEVLGVKFEGVGVKMDRVAAYVAKKSGLEKAVLSYKNKGKASIKLQHPGGYPRNSYSPEEIQNFINNSSYEITPID
jgi:RHS repeat-associated protein